MEAKPSVQYRPKKVSERNAPKTGAKFVVPLKMLRVVVAVTLCTWKMVVRYTSRFDDVPIVPSFSNVSFPAVSIN